MRLAAQILNEGREPGLDEAARHAGIAHASRGCWLHFRSTPRAGSSMCRST